MSNNDHYNLTRFLNAQSQDYEIALRELRSGKKLSHWIWYIFPQVAGLGTSSMAQDFAIRSLDEGKAYLEHEILGQRLNQCAQALLKHKNLRIYDIMGFPDELKLRSSMTLFAVLSPAGSVFHQVLDIFYDGMMDTKTLEFLGIEQ